MSCLHGNNIKYPAGKDIIESFGDGTYQISSGNNKSLFNVEYSSCIIQQVEQFYETHKKVYVIGSTTQEYIVDESKVERRYKIYAVIELQDNTMTLCTIPTNSLYPDIFIYRLYEMIDNCNITLISDLSALPDEDLKVFQEME